MNQLGKITNTELTVALKEKQPVYFVTIIGTVGKIHEGWYKKHRPDPITIKDGPFYTNYWHAYAAARKHRIKNRIYDPDELQRLGWVHQHASK
jgi:hypothetical protein